ncbi:hypothetical protein QN277_022547 [Acacia crassicarpa]|uniref:non-specific serine/threonine protein kinase n=1 Tax=Acacia crassicarpa TaxID=499986 RepID=A0AAE1JJW5_9FABA|nr:hypothetical protein QN277_022547 [Acacia crassicarpa]
MYSCKLGSLALLLALSASHHFILLHCLEPSNAPEPNLSDYVPPSNYGPPSPLPPLPPTPTPSYYVSPSPPPPLPPTPTPSNYGLPSLPPPPPLPPMPTPSPQPPLPLTPPNSAPKPMTTPEVGGPKPTPPPNSAPAPTTGKPKTESAVSIGLIAGAVIGSAVLIVGLFGCFFIWRKRRTRQSAQPPKANGEVAPSSASVGLTLGPRRFTYEELESATNGFSDSNFLGEGGYGVVHKGVHPYDVLRQTYVAVKQLKYGIQEARREFLNETAIISRIHHKHLVSLVGYCMDEARSKIMLVYEFVSNNNLAFHLHGTETIDWKTRMKIAIGSAKGLAYLHEECHPKIIHRDIKASNILLDDNFEPKVADFGMAKFSIDSQVMPTRIMGSFGYLAPEYAASGNLTEKADVFSFGVVLLELITGRKPVGDTKKFPNGSLVEWARQLFSEALDSGHFEGIADERLENDYDVEEMFRMISCAANCVRHSATNRPPMTQVVKALQGEIWLENNMTMESPVRRQLSEDMNKLRKMAMGSLSTAHSDQFHSTTSTSTSSSGSKIFR